MKSAGPRELYLVPRGLNQPLELPGGWDAHGVIARISTHAQYQQVCDLSVPVVNVSGVRLKGVDLPRVAPDEPAAAALAMTHLRSLGLQQFAYYGPMRRSDSIQRRQVFVEAVASQGFTCDVYRPGLSHAGNNWIAERDAIAAWLAALPKPVGVMAWGDVNARRVADACIAQQIAIPEEVAIVGVDSDDLINSVMFPTLSGVQLASVKQGFEAAQMLHRLMLRKSVKERDLRLLPLGVAVRQSSSQQAIDDPHIRKAVEFIRDHAIEGLSVAEVLRVVPLPRRTLERRFHTILNRSPAAEIRRVRFDEVRRLLAETNLPMPDIAFATGWKYVGHMISQFNKEFGLTPLQYRKHVQAR